jgi:hypothetical protein
LAESAIAVDLNTDGAILLLLSGSCAAKSADLLFPDGSYYVGQLDAEQRPHGEGTQLNGNRYEGEWQNGKRHGHGRYRMKDGREYVGDWAVNKRQGLGLFSGPDFGIYEGEWKNDKRNGFGVKRAVEGKIISCGLWKDDIAVESRSIPLSKLPVKAFLSDAGELEQSQSALLLSALN